MRRAAAPKGREKVVFSKGRTSQKRWMSRLMVFDGFGVPDPLFKFMV